MTSISRHGGVDGKPPYPSSANPRVTRAEGNVVGSFGRVGHQIGEFYNLHFIGIDGKGNVYTTEVQGKRVQKFKNLGGL